MQRDPDAIRKRELGLIHLAKAHFKTTHGMTDDDYRAVLQQVTGKTSAADLDAAGREKLLKHFKAKGFVVKPKAGASRMPPKLDGQVTKLLAMWWSLAEAKAVTRPVGSQACLLAVEAWGKEQLAQHAVGPLGSLRFANAAQLAILIESMKKWGDRVGAFIRRT